MKNCYVVTSAIEVDNAHLLKEDQIRTILSTTDRLTDTKKSVECILKHDKDATIFVVDISRTNFEAELTQDNNVRYIHLETHNHKLADQCRTHPSKSWGEAMILLEFLKLYKNFVKINFDYLIKLSGRYYFTDNWMNDLSPEHTDNFLFKNPVFWDQSSLGYIPEYFLPSDMYVGGKLGGYYTVAYAVGNKQLDRYETVMFTCASLTDSYSKYFYVDVEYLLYKIFCNLDLRKYVIQTDWTIEGRGGQNGKYFKL